MKKVRQVLIVVVICLFAMEILLRLSGAFKTASEKTGRGYMSSYGEVHTTWYNTHKPNDTLIPPATDFQYQFSTNSIGIRDRDYDYNNTDSVYRILVTGNSYVEGVGAPYDSTWPRLIEKDLHSRNMKVEVIDAGIAGNDIMYDYVLYRDKLSKYHPNLVIATMNNSDYVYYTFRGGMDRFHEDGMVHYLAIPWYDFFYHYSHLFRALLAVSQLPIEGAYLSKNGYKTIASQATISFAGVLDKYSKLAAKNDAKFALVIFPKASEIDLNDFLSRNSRNNFEQLSRLLAKDNIPNFNIIGSMKNKLGRKEKVDFTYAHDGHYKPFGYSVMAQLTVDSLIRSGIIKP